MECEKQIIDSNLKSLSIQSFGNDVKSWADDALMISMMLHIDPIVECTDKYYRLTFKKEHMTWIYTKLFDLANTTNNQTNKE